MMMMQNYPPMLLLLLLLLMITVMSTSALSEYIYRNVNEVEHRILKVSQL